MPIVLVEAPRPLRPWSSYVDQIYADIPNDFEVRFVGGTTNIEDVDVIHASGTLDRLMGISANASAAEKLAKTETFVQELTDKHVKLVRTVHTPKVIDQDKTTQQAASLLDDHTDLFVTVDSSIAQQQMHRSVTIPYADLTERFVGYPTKPMNRGRLLALAHSRQAKESQDLLKTFGFTRLPDLTLRVVGPFASEFQQNGHQERLPKKVSWRSENLSDAAYIEEITSAELIFPPDPDDLDGYHLMMMALTFNRPVAVPETRLTKQVAEELGREWVLTYSAPLTPATIDKLYDAATSSSRNVGPYFRHRSFSTTSQKYFEVFRQVARVADVKQPSHEETH